MEDYPRTLAEFERRFATEAACREYLRQLRWPQGMVCPRCPGSTGWTTRRGLWVCAACAYQASVTAGTIFQDTRLPLTLWFRAIWWVTSQKVGASALGVQRVLGLGSYRTAWTWLHKLRRAMVRPGGDRVTGAVEVDETFLGGPEGGVYGRKLRKKALIVVAAQADGPRIGRIRMRRVPDSAAASLHAFVREAVAPGSVVHTDGWEGYTGLPAYGYTHQVTPLRGRKGAAAELLPRVHHVVALLKRWLLGTHQGGVSLAHLDYYLDEFTFWFNRRTSRHRGKLFYRLLQQAVAVAPIRYRAMVKRARDRRPKDHNP